MKEPKVGRYNIVLNDETIDLTELNKILDMDLRERRGIMICLLCDKVRPSGHATRQSMRMHVETHVDDLNFLCTKCDDKVFTTRASYQIHYKKHN